MDENTLDMRRDGLICLAIVAAALSCFWPVVHFPFFTYDDPSAVSENRFVLEGFTVKGVIVAFTDTEIHQIWLPLTWLSHMLDVELFGRNAGGHHFTSLMIHTANIVLLFVALRKMTGRRWPTAFVAGLFAIHPLNVEPVAWIAARRDILCAFFFLLTLLAYVGYVRKPSVWRYMLVVLGHASSLACKPMMVTLPCVLLLLDYWPLGRIRGDIPVRQEKLKEYWRLIREKLPLLGLSAGFVVLATIADPASGSPASTSVRSMGARIANACIAYVTYIAKMVWPKGLAPIYPHVPAPVIFWQTAGAVLVLAVVTAVAVKLRRRAPYLVVGWFWFLGILVPVIGIVQQSAPQLISDKYTYVPGVGLFIMAAWGIPDLLRRWRHKKVALPLSATVVLALLLICSIYQVVLWRSNEALLRHTLSVTSDNASAHKCMGDVLLDRFKPEEAAEHFNEALRIRPGYLGAENNLGLAMLQLSDYEEAAKLFREVCERYPRRSIPRHNLALALTELGRYEEAIDWCEEAVRLNPYHEEARAHLELLRRKVAEEPDAKRDEPTQASTE